MISLQAPLWLLPLAVLLPLIYWLHRFRQQAIIHPSTTVFLWRKMPAQAQDTATPGPVDPRWLLRALICSLLFIALGEPVLQQQRALPADVWVDDSLSMFTLEDGQTRLQSALTKLYDYLATTESSPVRLHSLGRSAEPLELGRDSTHWPAQVERWLPTTDTTAEPNPPPTATLSPHSRHILLTDGADRKLNQWAQNAPLHHLIRVGRATQNLAVTRLSLRQPLQPDDAARGLVRIDNPGKEALAARLSLQHGTQPILSKTVNIPAGEKVQQTFIINDTKTSLPTAPLLARIESANDALKADNRLRLSAQAASLPLRYQTTGECHHAILAALAAHPALVMTNRQPALLIDCSQLPAVTTLPVLRFAPPPYRQRTTLPAHWHANASDLQALRLPAGLAYSDNAPPLTTTIHPLLSAGDRSLIAQTNDNTKTISVYLDGSDPTLTMQPEFPLLVYGLVEKLTGQKLDFSPQMASRHRNASRIAPTTFDFSPAPVPAPLEQPDSLVQPVLFTVLALLLIDALLAFRVFSREAAA